MLLWDNKMKKKKRDYTIFYCENLSHCFSLKDIYTFFKAILSYDFK